MFQSIPAKSLDQVLGTYLCNQLILEKEIFWKFGRKIFRDIGPDLVDFSAYSLIMLIQKYVNDPF